MYIKYFPRLLFLLQEVGECDGVKIPTYSTFCLKVVNRKSCEFAGTVSKTSVHTKTGKITSFLYYNGENL